VLRTAFGPNGVDVRGRWRKLDHEKLHNLCCSENIKRIPIKKAEMGRACSAHGKMRNAPELKCPFRKPRCRWEDDIKIDLRLMGWRLWIGFIWLRLGTVGGL
jgi:hypothetical protein